MRIQVEVAVSNVLLNLERLLMFTETQQPCHNQDAWKRYETVAAS